MAWSYSLRSPRWRWWSRLPGHQKPSPPMPACFEPLEDRVLLSALPHLPSGQVAAHLHSEAAAQVVVKGDIQGRRDTPPAATPADDKFVPFKVDGAGRVETDPATLAGRFTSSGVATHLGRWTAQGTLQFLPPPEDGSVALTGEITFTAANGDELQATFEGALDLATGLAEATYTVTGGTGRFQNATGQFVLTHQLTPEGGPGSLDGTFTAVGEGTISRPNRR